MTLHALVFKHSLDHQSEENYRKFDILKLKLIFLWLSSLWKLFFQYVWLVQSQQIQTEDSEYAMP